jgi:periplasmic divalent cation tolerance protein
MSNATLVLVSCLSENAETMASTIVTEGLAACVSIVPGLLSIYRWQGELHKDHEVLLLIKTNKAQWQALERRIKELHSYEVPEIIAIPIELGHAPYLHWLNLQLEGNRALSGERAP